MGTGSGSSFGLETDRDIIISFPPAAYMQNYHGLNISARKVEFLCSCDNVVHVIGTPWASHASLLIPAADLPTSVALNKI